MIVACKRCGLLDGNHTGYHREDELPFKRGDRVLVRAGAIIRATHPVKREIVNKRTRPVTVLSVHNGLSKHAGYGSDMEELWHHIDAPAVLWAGTGGYWHYAAMSDVKLDERAVEGR